MKLDSARYEGGNLILNTSDQAARRFVYGFKPGEYEITKSRKKRSLDANAKAWALIGEIAAVVGVSKETVYSSAIHDVGAFEVLQMKTEAFQDFSRIWNSRGMGWFAELVSNNGTEILVHAHYGSSVYDTHQMSRFIDYLIQEAKNLDIETMSEREKSLLLEEWDAKQKDGSAFNTN